MASGEIELFVSPCRLFVLHSPFAIRYSRMDPMANVTLRNVRKTYAGGVEAIKGIDFEVGDGQFCVLVGPSGCGKSTLLRMVAELETITGGDIDIGGRLVYHNEPPPPPTPLAVHKYPPHPPTNTHH